MSEPLVSVIIPCYNNGRYLSEAIESVLGQTWRCIEIIVIDDGSSDDTESVAARYTGRIVFRKQRNQGASVARNLGIQVSRGSYLQFLDADDLLERRKIEHHVRYLEEHADVGIVYGDARYFTDEDPNLRLCSLVGDNLPWQAEDQWIENSWAAPGTMVEKFLDRNLLPVNTALVRRSVVEQAGAWDEQLRAVEDWELWLRYAAKGVKYQFLKGEETLALIRSRLDSTSRDLKRNLQAMQAMHWRASRYLAHPHLRLRNYEMIKRNLFLYGMRRPQRKWQQFRAAMANSCPPVWRSFFSTLLRP
jgi:glycosyltransferase involved in cell wall biosynthesis